MIKNKKHSGNTIIEILVVMIITAISFLALTKMQRNLWTNNLFLSDYAEAKVYLSNQMVFYSMSEYDTDAWVWINVGRMSYKTADGRFDVEGKINAGDGTSSENVTVTVTWKDLNNKSHALTETSTFTQLDKTLLGNGLFADWGT